MLEPGKGRTHAGQLALRLPAGADEAQRPGLGPRETARGHRACRSGAELAEPIGLDQREQLGAVGGEEREDEPSPLREAHIRLYSGAAKLEIGRGHHVQAPALEPDPAARLQLDHPARHPREAGVDDLDCISRAEKLLDVGFAQEERHRSGIV